MSQCVYYTEDSTHLAPETRRRASTDCWGFVPNPYLNRIPSLFFGKYIKAHFGNIVDDRQLEAPLTEHLGRPWDPYLSKHKQERNPGRSLPQRRNCVVIEEYRF